MWCSTHFMRRGICQPNTDNEKASGNIADGGLKRILLCRLFSSHDAHPAHELDVIRAGNRKWRPVNPGT